METKLASDPTKKAAAVKSSAEIVVSNDDLLLEILFRLPLKPLIRSELVSKQWHACITNLSFLRLVISSQTPSPAGLIFSIRIWNFPNNVVGYFPLSTDTADESTINVPSLEKFNRADREARRYEIKQSCNGLQFCCSYFDNIWTYYVYNPTTNRCFTLPGIDGHERYLRMVPMGLAFDPAKSPNYKVFYIRELSSSRLKSGWSSVNQIYIYSSDTHRWRVSGEPFSIQQVIAFHKAVYGNGSIHWITYDKEDFYFDMEDEMLKVMPTLPTKPQWNRHYFGESGDHLHYVQILSLQFNVYELKRDYSEWFIKYHVDLSTVSFTRRESACVQDILCLCAIICGEDEKDSFLIWGAPGNCIQYNLVSKTSKMLYGPFEKLRDQLEGPVHEDGYMRVGDVFQYVESICPVE